MKLNALTSLTVLGFAVISGSAALTQTVLGDPVPLKTGAVSATHRDPAPMSLRPLVTCKDMLCEITMKGWNGSSTSLAPLPLPYPVKLFEGDDWIARPMDSETLSFGPETAQYGWTVGWDESAVDVFVSPQLIPSPEGFFVVEVRGGFETVFQTHLVYEITLDGRLIRHLEVQDGQGPVVSSLEALEDGYLHRVAPYDESLNDLIPPVETRYWWAANDHGETLMSRAEMYDAGIVETENPPSR